MRIVEFYKIRDNVQEKAIVTKYNAYVRVLDIDNKEHFFSEFTQAVKFLLNDGYTIEYLLRPTLVDKEKT